MFTPNKQHSKPHLSVPQTGHYVVYGWSRSYFTRKLTAALTFYNASFEMQRKTPDTASEIEFRSGTHQIPVLHTSDNWMIADTTPQLQLLDARFPERAMFPKSSLGFIVHLLEEFFDEWLARTTVHWRWNYPENHELLSLDLADGDESIAAKFRDWGSRVCRATGISSEVQKAAAEKEYLDILTVAERQLQQTEFLLGDRPTALDCIVLGGLRAHFNYDPAPKKVIEQKFPTVIQWCTQRADAWQGKGDLCSMDNLTEFAQYIIESIKNTYAPFALANKEALLQQQKAFVIPMFGEDVSYLARPYVEKSRQMLALHFQSLSGDDQQPIKSLLAEHDLLAIVESQS